MPACKNCTCCTAVAAEPQIVGVRVRVRLEQRVTGPAAYKPRQDIDLQAWRVPTETFNWESTEFEDLTNWINANDGRPSLTRYVDSRDGLTHWFDLNTVHGRTRAHPGDWIILGTVGFFIRTDDQFHADYVAVDPAPIQFGTLSMTQHFDDQGNTTKVVPNKPYPDHTSIANSLLVDIDPQWIDPTDREVLVFADDCRYRIGALALDRASHELHRIAD